MKKINLLFVVLFATIISVTTSCKKGDGPTLTVSADKTTAWQNDTITFTYSVSSNADLKTLDWSSSDFVLVEGTQEDGGSIELTGTSVVDQTITVVVKGTQVAGDITFTFTATDKDGAEVAATEDVVVSIEEPAVIPTIVSYNAKLMGAQSASAGSYFSTNAGDVMTFSQATANSGAVDFIYSFNTTANIYSPVNDDAVGSALTTKNATVFGEYTGSKAFADITAADVNALTIGAAKKTSTLAVGSKFVFATSTGKKGIAEVTAFVTGTSGSVTINVKVQN